jgi:hypothetical protein
LAGHLPAGRRAAAGRARPATREPRLVERIRIAMAFGNARAARSTGGASSQATRRAKQDAARAKEEEAKKKEAADQEASAAWNALRTMRPRQPWGGR